VSDPTTAGVILGQTVGKTVGLLGATALAARLSIGRLPAGTTWRHVLGLAALARVGFTVALFVTFLGIRLRSPRGLGQGGHPRRQHAVVSVGCQILRTSPHRPLRHNERWKSPSQALDEAWR